MKLFIDSHVHYYPQYNSGKMYAAFMRRTLQHGAGIGVMMLAEREGMGFPGTRAARPLVVIPGRQIACAERVEILALGTEATFNDGIPAKDAIRRVADAGALPVLAWGLGKWMFKREKVVEDLLATFKPSELAIGDSSMRPVFWREPRLMRQARAAGFRILHGSDPLPPKSEETRAGQYGDIVDIDDLPELDESKPVAPQILRILREAPLTTVGHRAGPIQFLTRMIISKIVK